MELKKVTFYEQPAPIEREGRIVRLNFDITPSEETVIDGENISTEQTEEQQEQRTEKRPVWLAYVVRVEQPLTCSRIIDAIITAAYPADVMQAIVNNHLLDTEDEEHRAEFREMQEWRNKAKLVAAEVLGI